MSKRGRFAGNNMVQDPSVLASILARRLKHAGMTIATAESCTGGMIASALTDIQGASKWFNQGWITYSNEAKTNQLGVEEELFCIEEGTAGAVSSEVAAAMAKGAAINSDAQIAIGVTGIAGPTGSTETKEVGLVWVGVYINGEILTKSAEFGHGDRHSNKEAFTTFALRSALEVWEELLEVVEEENEEGEENTQNQDFSREDIKKSLEQFQTQKSSEEDWQGGVAWSDGEDVEIEENSNQELQILDSDIDWEEE